MKIDSQKKSMETETKDILFQNVSNFIMVRLSDTSKMAVHISDKCVLMLKRHCI